MRLGVARDKNDAPLVHRLNQQLRLDPWWGTTDSTTWAVGWKPTDITYAIEISPHKYKYTSGVIAHAIEDNQALAAQSWYCSGISCIDGGAGFCGITHRGQDDLVGTTYAWTKSENHFLIPRINLRTGKYFNPHPHQVRKVILMRSVITSTWNITPHVQMIHDARGWQEQYHGTVKMRTWLQRLSDAVQLMVTQSVM